ncbi:MAG: hypothetical protein FVQ83_17125 [Chloroflexi bacterium]|nr:hypothetical protein [Chloroflexota bacterium]
MNKLPKSSKLLSPLQATGYSARIIYFIPEMYLGLPARLPTNDSTSNSWNPSEVSEEWRRHDALYEPISLIYQIQLPGIVNQVYKNLVMVRETEIIESLSDGNLWGFNPSSGPLFLWIDENGLRLMNNSDVQEIFRYFTELLRHQIPDFTTLTSTHFVRSFEAYYETYGMTGVFRYYISERARSYFEMPIRYSRVTAAQVNHAHTVAHEKYHAALMREIETLGKVDPFKHLLGTLT